MRIALLLALAGCSAPFQAGEPSPPDPLDSGAETADPTKDASGETFATGDSSSAADSSQLGASDSSSMTAAAPDGATRADGGPADAADTDAQVCCTLLGTTLCSHTRCIDCGGDTICAY